MTQIICATEGARSTDCSDAEVQRARAAISACTRVINCTASRLSRRYNTNAGTSKFGFADS
jgi:hypothetical protein